MSTRGAFVGGVEDLSRTHEFHEVAPGRPSPQYVTVTFAQGRKGLLDLSDRRSAVWAEVLDSLRETGQPAYVQIDPESSMITELLLPVPYKVAGIRPAQDGDLEIELVISHARHFLRPSNPDFDELRGILEAALEQGSTVLVTETRDEHEIIDVRPTDRPLQGQV